MPRTNKVKAVSWDPELLARVELASRATGESFSEWVRSACQVRLDATGAPPAPPATAPLPVKKAIAARRGAPAPVPARRHSPNCQCRMCRPA